VVYGRSEASQAFFGNPRRAEHISAGGESQGSNDARGLVTPVLNDPPPTTPYTVVDEGGLLRLRHYLPAADVPAAAPLLLVYSLFKRPYILDLLPQRSLVRTLTSQGFSVYLTDWMPPGPDDAWRGLDAYVNVDLARAIDCIRRRENAAQVSLIGCCFGGLLALVYAALRPQAVRNFVPFALPLHLRPQFAPIALEWLVNACGNVPAWWIHSAMNAALPSSMHLSSYLAEDLGEPDLARAAAGMKPAVVSALEPWLESDVPLAGQFFREGLRDAYWNRQLAEGRLRVGERTVDLGAVRCPVLSICAARDRLVPPPSATPLIGRLGSREARNLVFPTGHLGLMASRAAHERLWPGVGLWLRSRVARDDRAPAPAPPLHHAPAAPAGDTGGAAHASLRAGPWLAS
jgi:poly[(R)-3-hydroxyalkanoate] polymerase subunit PhaC